jgi:hypothetical protein
MPFTIFQISCVILQVIRGGIAGAVMRSELSCVPSLIEEAIIGLQQERCSCVSRLCALLAGHGMTPEAEDYMRRLETINEALIRVSRFEVAH